LYLSLIWDGTLCEILWQIDRLSAEEVRRGGCGCGGKLHRADYVRKPRGGPAEIDPGQGKRLSLCCAVDGCRKRATPPSVRFLGRKVYQAVVVVVASALRHGMTPARAGRLCTLIGVDRRTLARWRRWWRTTFAHSLFWRVVGSRFQPSISATALPLRLLGRFPGDPRAQLVALLRFIAPITTSSARFPRVATDPQRMHAARRR
jgi:hypothetical protein